MHLPRTKSPLSRSAQPSNASRVRGRSPKAALLAVALTGATLCPLLAPMRAQATIVERVVAVVGQDAILLSDLKERALPFLLRVYASVPEGPQRTANISQIYDFVLQTMVDEKLEAEAAHSAGVEISDEQVDAAIQQTAAQNEVSVNEILIEAKQSGLTIPNYREELRRQLLQRTMMELRLRGRVNISETDLRAAYRRIALEERLQQVQRTAQLVIPAGSTIDEQDRSRIVAQRLAKQAQAGVDFRDLMVDGELGTSSGLRPPLPPMEEPEEIQRASTAMEVGEVSQPILVGGNWVILKLLERPPSALPPYVEARAQIHERVYVEKMNKAREHWLKGLRRRTHIEIRL